MRTSPTKGWLRRIAALRRIAERQQETFVAARQRLQADVALHREFQRLAGDVAGDMVPRQLAVGFDQPLAGEDVGDARHRFGRRRALLAVRATSRAVGQFGIEQAVRVVEGRAEHLAAGQVLVGRRHAALDQHRGRCRPAARSRSAAASCDRRAPGRSPRSGRRATARSPAPPVPCRRASLRPSRGRRRAPAARRSGRGGSPARGGRRGGGRRAAGGHCRWRPRHP